MVANSTMFIDFSTKKITYALRGYVEIYWINKVCFFTYEGTIKIKTKVKKKVNNSLKIILHS